MNCDQVFQHLTSLHPAPVNGQLERHLSDCRSCRELAELFQPAVEVFDSGSNEDDAADAPESWERVWDAVSIAERSAVQLKDTRPATTWRARAGSLTGCAALLAAGVLLGASLNWAGMLGGGEKLRSEFPSSSTAKLPADDAECRCAKLVSHARRASEDGVCPVCQARGAKINIVTLCMTCHENPTAEPATKVSLQDLQSSLQSLRSWLKTTPQPFATFLLEARLNSFKPNSVQAS